uniref:Transmembrane protein n=1 Tax=Caenorhabditis tropicalis TaxID=1561998 RepID=A0A1I7U6L8_9PELO
MSVSEFRRLREEEEEMEKNMCLYNLPEYLAVAALPLFTVGLILTGISVYVYTRPCQLKTTVGFFLFL